MTSKAIRNGARSGPCCSADAAVVGGEAAAADDGVIDGNQMHSSDAAAVGAGGGAVDAVVGAVGDNVGFADAKERFVVALPMARATTKTMRMLKTMSAPDDG